MNDLPQDADRAGGELSDGDIHAEKPCRRGEPLAQAKCPKFRVAVALLLRSRVALGAGSRVDVRAAPAAGFDAAI
jgi:hypothetical protein